MSKNNGTDPKRKPTAAEILAKGGLTSAQIARARLKNYAEDTAWTIFITQTVLVAGIETLKKMIPDISDEMIQQWAKDTLTTARLELAKAKKK